MKPRLASLLPCLIALFALLPLSVSAQPATLVEGRDYALIPGGKPFAPLNDKVEVAEVFSYTCIHCAELQKRLDAWKPKLPGHVRFTPVPVPDRGWGRAFYAAQNLGVLERSHSAVFRALHEDRAMPFNPSAAELARFYATWKVKPETFAAEFGSKRVDAQLETALAFARAIELRGTPTLVVNGKYRVLGRDYDDMLRITDRLIAREHAAK